MKFSEESFQAKDSEINFTQNPRFIGGDFFCFAYCYDI